MVDSEMGVRGSYVSQTIMTVEPDETLDVEHVQPQAWRRSDARLFRQSGESVVQHYRRAAAIGREACRGAGASVFVLENVKGRFIRVRVKSIRCQACI